MKKQIEEVLEACNTQAIMCAMRYAETDEVQYKYGYEKYTYCAAVVTGLLGEVS